jgi:hypothetical protein
MKRFILTNTDLLGAHPLGQTGGFLLSKINGGGLDQPTQSLLCPIRGRDEAIQPGQC